MNCRACEIDRNDEQVKQMPEHTCGKDGPVERAQPKTAMTQSDAPNEGREEITAEVFFKAEVDRQWLKRSGFSSDPGSISRIPFVIYPAMFKVMNDYADLKNSELRDRLSKERENSGALAMMAAEKQATINGLKEQLEKEREMRKELVDALKIAKREIVVGGKEFWEIEPIVFQMERAIAKASELDKNKG